MGDVVHRWRFRGLAGIWPLNASRQRVGEVGGGGWRGGKRQAGRYCLHKAQVKAAGGLISLILHYMPRGPITEKWSFVWV